MFVFTMPVVAVVGRLVGLLIDGALGGVTWFGSEPDLTREVATSPVTPLRRLSLH
jgi:hypothetical protein